MVAVRVARGLRSLHHPTCWNGRSKSRAESSRDPKIEDKSGTGEPSKEVCIASSNVQLLAMNKDGITTKEGGKLDLHTGDEIRRHTASMFTWTEKA